MVNTVKMTVCFSSKFASRKGFIILSLMAKTALSPMAASGFCILPVPPSIPDSDRAFAEYSDLIAKDFEQYFADVTQYSICIDQEYERFIRESRQVSEAYDSFLTRAEALGVMDKVAIVP